MSGNLLTRRLTSFSSGRYSTLIVKNLDNVAWLKSFVPAFPSEGLAVASHNLPDEDFSMTRDIILNIMEKTKDNRCSMLQDIERGRRTEIDYINGFIVQESGRLGLKAPVNAAIADLIRHLERYPQ